MLSVKKIKVESQQEKKERRSLTKGDTVCVYHCICIDNHITACMTLST
jgi:hypothetical protein